MIRFSLSSPLQSPPPAYSCRGSFQDFAAFFHFLSSARITFLARPAPLLALHCVTQVHTKTGKRQKKTEGQDRSEAEEEAKAGRGSGQRQRRGPAYA